VSENIVIDFVEDNERLARDIRQRLGQIDDFLVRTIFSDGESALAKVPQSPPDVMIVDLNLPGMSGVELIVRLKAAKPGIQFLVLTMYEETNLIFDALKAGATGYLLKRATNDELTDAIRQIHAGGSPMSPSIARRVVQSFQATVPAAGDDSGLSERERDVLELLTRGALYKEIADKLSISIDTVRSHIRKIYQKLQVHSRAQAVAKFLGDRK
jgi:DNA-binding NarL/FixJ family response regulator